MLRAGRGSIVNIGSIAGVTALGRGHIAYSMAMGAVVQMTRELSTEWSGRGVRVNAILPAQVVNAGLSRRMAEDPTLEATYLRGIPCGRLGRPNDVRVMLRGYPRAHLLITGLTAARVTGMVVSPSRVRAAARRRCRSGARSRGRP